MDLSQVTGTGPRGRVTAVDIEEFIAAGGSATAPAAAAAAAPAGVAGVGFSDVAVPADKLVRSPPSACAVSKPTFCNLSFFLSFQAYAATMELSKQTIPHYYLTIDMNLEKLLAIRAELNSTLAEDEQISVNDFFIRASALAMKTVPDMNSSWMDTFVRQYHSVNTAVTVGDGVPTPVIANTNALGLFAISSAAKGALEKHSTGALTSADISGATFTISNLGMFGIKTASPVISPNQAGHLAIGNIEKRIIPNDDPDSDEIYKEAYMVTATMSCDHRVVDGAVGATWLQVFKGLVEKPITMLL
jgi:pyruvate dehydrogenase E2 component (dihydrolipoamide acetyltransferase)